MGDADAVTLPLAIRNTSCDNAEIGISNNPLPLPLNIDAVIVDLKIPEEVTIKKSLIVTPVFISSPLFGEIDAVAEPLAILNESPLNAERGILNKPAPSPTKEPDTEPVIC